MTRPLRPLTMADFIGMPGDRLAAEIGRRMDDPPPMRTAVVQSGPLAGAVVPAVGAVSAELVALAVEIVPEDEAS